MFVIKKLLNPVFLLSVILFVIPFFWFEYGEGDFGGDSSRLYFFDPGAWLLNYGLSEISVSDFGWHHPTYFWIPFLSFLKLLHLICWQQTHLVLASFNGLLLAVSFFSVYLIIRDLSFEISLTPVRRMGAIIGGLFFVFAPLMTYNWQKSLYSWHQIAVYPLLVWFLIKYIRERRTSYLLYSLLLTVVFAINFSIWTGPVFFSFFILVFPLLFIYAVLHQRLWWFLRGLVLGLILFALFHSWHLIPQVIAVASPSNALYQSAFSQTGKIDRGLTYFEAVRPMVKLTYNMTAFPQFYLYNRTNVSPAFLGMLKNYGTDHLSVFFLFPLIIFAGLGLSSRDFRRPRILFFSITMLWLLSMFLMTANLFGIYGPKGYAALFYLPGFGMFRSFYGVFLVPLVFFFALALGFAISYVLRFLTDATVQKTTVIVLLAIIIYGGIPLITGQVVNVIMNDTNNLELSNRLPDDFLSILSQVKDLELDSKILTTPLTHFGYHIIQGNHGGAYVGPSPLSVLGGKQTFSGLSSFTIPQSSLISPTFTMKILADRDYETIKRLFALLNIGYIFDNSNPIAYRDGFTGWPYGQDLWRAFPDNQSVREFIDQMGYQPVLQQGSFTLYSAPDSFLPHLYIPRYTVNYRSTDDLTAYLTASPDYDLRTAFYQTGAELATTKIETADDTFLEFKKINPMKYRVRIHNLRDNIPIVFSNAYHPGWKLLVSASQPSFEPAAGPALISPVLQGTQQNQNLPDGQLTEALSLHSIDEKFHQRANEYANSWWLDLDYLKNNFSDQLRARPDGGYDIEMVLEFTQRQYFWAGTLLSLSTIITSIVWLLIWHFISYRKSFRRS